ncbi:hypothetical protein MMC07_004687 [Pseudocyphellaria aurata]|nr:hypothetical protein [Pseudocyphellaria aurata]
MTNLSAGSRDPGQKLNNASALSEPFIFQSGVPKPNGSAYSRVVVLPCMHADEVAWIKEEMPNVELAVYVVNNSTAPLHPPKNKGHEVMVYLTYIIDNYAHLPDIAIFMHAHRWTQHNSDLLDYDAVQMISKLSDDHVVREGYFNMRCKWDPGCPEWLNPSNLQATLEKQEEVVLSRCWKELFPLDPLPGFLAQACCAQFALSKERILSIPLSRFMFYRNWILMTPLSDYMSGRIWEYSWQYIFTGRHANCPAEHKCHCDGFGICFGGEAQYKAFLELRNQTGALGAELEVLKADEKSGNKFVGEGSMSESASVPFPIRYSQLDGRIQALKKELVSLKMDALERGQDARQRAEECGRSWEQEDGF